ncbi:uncharacterized protein LOC119671734 [Teleopsis dalmanni]|uniref:uncharacterized protein LOC119671734 n=1 Tax=Teleopsis dalmanni TaxID=139649 RepID=UPI0018CC9B8E|nr:uncharacterized protein LOC119671734 [Teleopsis dalmanni]
MSADSPRRSSGARGLAVPATVPPQVVSDRSILDSAIGFINDVTLAHQPHTESKDTITWARFEYAADISDPRFGEDWELEGNVAPPLLLILGYGLGVQVWAIPANGEAVEVLSWRHGIVSALRVLPTPSPTVAIEEHGRADEYFDSFADKRPLIALVEGSSSSSQPQFCAVNFISLKTGTQEKTIKFKNPVLDILANRSAIIITLHERIAVFDARTLDDRLSITTCYPSPGINPNPVALGPRWLAYAEQKLLHSKRSGGGCDGEGVASYTATVLNAAKSFGKGLRELGEQVAAGFTGTATSGSTSKNNSFDSSSGLDGKQAGVITIMDIKHPLRDYSPVSGTPMSGQAGSDPIVAHFVAHSEALVAMEFDNSGMLLLTADRRGHDFHVFRIQPHPVGSSLAAVHHLYVLHRGDTSAKVQNVSFSLDSRWVAVSTLRGTTHVFPITPYGGAIGVRTHTSLHVVNKLSRFHRSAGLSGEGRSSSPISHSESTTFVQSLQPYHNPTLPPFSRPVVVLPLTQLRQPFALGSPPGSAALGISGKSGSGAGTGASQRQRLSSLSDDNGKPLSVCAIFAKSRSWLLEPPNATREAPHRIQRKAVDSLFIMAGHGALIQYDLDTKLASNVAKEKICDDTPIELEVEAKAQWNLGRRKEGSHEITPPLSVDNWLIKDRNSCMLTDSTRQFDDGDDQTESWLSQVEIITHAGPHRRLWMGPQFVFKTYNTPSGSNLSHVDAEAVEIGICKTATSNTSATATTRERSSPLNMPLTATGRSAVPVLIESGSYSSIEQSPKLMDRFRHEHLDSEFTHGGDSRLKEDLADAMRESPSVSSHKDTGRNSSDAASCDNAPFYDAVAEHEHFDEDHGLDLNRPSSAAATVLASMLPNIYSYETSSSYESLDSLKKPSIEKIVNPLGTVTTITSGMTTEVKTDMLDEVVSQLAAEECVIHENCDESLFRPVVAIFCDENTRKRDEEAARKNLELCKPPEVIGNKLIVPVIAKEVDAELSKKEKQKLDAKSKMQRREQEKELAAQTKCIELSSVNKKTNLKQEEDKQENVENMKTVPVKLENKKLCVSDNREVEEKKKIDENLQKKIELDKKEMKIVKIEKKSVNLKCTGSVPILKTNLSCQKDPVATKTFKPPELKETTKKCIESVPKSKNENICVITKLPRKNDKVDTSKGDKKPASESEIQLLENKENKAVESKKVEISTTNAEMKPISSEELHSSKLKSKDVKEEIKCTSGKIESEEHNVDDMPMDEDKTKQTADNAILSANIKTAAAGNVEISKAEIKTKSTTPKAYPCENSKDTKLSTKSTKSTPPHEEEAEAKAESKESQVKTEQLNKKRLADSLIDLKNTKKEVPAKEIINVNKLNKQLNVVKTVVSDKVKMTKPTLIEPNKTSWQNKQKSNESASNSKTKILVTTQPIIRRVMSASDMKPPFDRYSDCNDVSDNELDDSLVLPTPIWKKHHFVDDTEESSDESSLIPIDEAELAIAIRMRELAALSDNDDTDDDEDDIIDESVIDDLSPSAIKDNANKEISKEDKEVTTLCDKKEPITLILSDTSKESKGAIKKELKDTANKSANKKTESSTEEDIVTTSKVAISYESKLFSDNESIVKKSVDKTDTTQSQAKKPTNVGKVKVTPPSSPKNKSKDIKVSAKKEDPKIITEQPKLTQNNSLKLSKTVTESAEVQSAQSIDVTDACVNSLKMSPVKEKTLNAKPQSPKKQQLASNTMKIKDISTPPPITSPWKTLSGADLISKNLSSFSSAVTNVEDSFPSLGKSNKNKKVCKSIFNDFETAVTDNLGKLLLDLPTPVKSSDNFTEAPPKESRKRKKPSSVDFKDFPILKPLESLSPLPALEPLEIISGAITKQKTLNDTNELKPSLAEQVSLISFESPLQENPALTRKITPPPRGFTEQNLIFALCGSLHYENENGKSSTEKTHTPTVSVTRSDSIHGEFSNAEYKPLTKNDEQYISLDQCSQERNLKSTAIKTNDNLTSSPNSSASEEIIVLEEKKMSKKQRRKKQQTELQKQKEQHNNSSAADEDEELRPLINMSDSHLENYVDTLVASDHFAMSSSHIPTTRTTQLLDDIIGIKQPTASTSLFAYSTTTDSEGPMPATTSDDNVVYTLPSNTSSIPNKMKTKKLEHKINLIAAIEAATSSSTSSAEESGVESGNIRVGDLLSLSATPILSLPQSSAVAAQQSAIKKKTKRRKR